jgi:hypothetical protein
MRRVPILVFAVLASLMACNRGSSAPDSEIRVTRTELISDHNLQDDPQECWITATGRRGRSRVEYIAVNPNGSCPEIETVVVNHDGVLLRKNDAPASPDDSSRWSAFVQSAKEIR